MVFLGGNAPSCQTVSSDFYPSLCLTEITGANTRRVPIHTVYVADVYTDGQQFWRELADANGGTFSEVTSN